MVTCPACDGVGVVQVGGPDYFGNVDSGDCALCGGDGECTPDRAAWWLESKAAAS